MTDHDRARVCYRLACAVAGAHARKNGARPWLARIAGYSRLTPRGWGDDGWPNPARKVLDDMGAIDPREWPKHWRA